MGRSYKQQEIGKPLRSEFRDYHLLPQVSETDVSVELSVVTMHSL